MRRQVVRSHPSPVLLEPGLVIIQAWNCLVSSGFLASEIRTMRTFSERELRAQEWEHMWHRRCLGMIWLNGELWYLLFASGVVRMLWFFVHRDISRWCVLRNVEYESEEWRLYEVEVERVCGEDGILWPHCYSICAMWAMVSKDSIMCPVWYIFMLCLHWEYTYLCGVWLCVKSVSLC